MDEAAFIKSMRSASEVRDKGEVKKLKTDLAKKEKRSADLDLLIKKVYEDNAMGKLPDRRYEMLSSDYEKEQQEFEVSIKEIQEKLTQFEEDTDRTVFARIDVIRAIWMVIVYAKQMFKLTFFAHVGYNDTPKGYG